MLQGRSEQGPQIKSPDEDEAKRIKHNDLLPWFLEDHGQLPDAYKKSCQKFFEAASHKQQATSHKLATIRKYT